MSDEASVSPFAKNVEGWSGMAVVDVEGDCDVKKV